MKKEREGRVIYAIPGLPCILGSFVDEPRIEWETVGPADPVTELMFYEITDDLVFPPPR